MKTKNYKKIQRDVLISSTIISWVGLLLLITYFILDANIEPYPERPFIYQMDEDMIAAGQARNLMILVCIAFSGMGLELIGIGLATTTIYMMFSTNALFYKNQILINKFEIFWHWTWRILFSFVYVFLSQFLVWYFWLVWIKNYTNHLKKWNFVLNVSNNKFYWKLNKVLWPIILVLIPLVPVFSFCTYIVTSNMKSYSRIPLWNIDKYLTLSNNNPNIMYFYFDRTQVPMWNLLLSIENKINGNKSFISQFPEFTSYVNTVSLSGLTIYSNPSIYSGLLFSPMLKNSTDINFATKLIPNSQKRYNEMTYDDYYFFSLLALCQMLEDNNIKNISLHNIPYYSKEFTFAHGELDKLQRDFKNKANKDITVMDNETLAFEAFDAKEKLFKDRKVSEQIAFRNLASNYKFKSTEGGVFNSFFTQVHHNNYNLYTKNGEYKTYPNTKYYFGSMWQSIFTLKDILNRLKNEPFLDENGQQMLDNDGNKISVYDKTLFYILSDHGVNIKTDVDNYQNILNWCVSNKLISNQDKSNILYLDQWQFTPAIMIKNFKYDKDNNVIEKKHNFYNKEKIIALSDLSIIMEHLLCDYYKTEFNPSHFMDKSLLKDTHLFGNMSTLDIVNNMYLENPLNDPNNSVNSDSQREFLLGNPYNWRYFYNKKTFDYSNKWKFKPKQDSFFSDENLVKF